MRFFTNINANLEYHILLIKYLSFRIKFKYKLLIFLKILYITYTTVLYLDSNPVNCGWIIYQSKPDCKMITQSISQTTSSSELKHTARKHFTYHENIVTINLSTNENA